MKTRRGCPRHPKKAAFPGHMRESLIRASSEAHLSLGSSTMDTMAQITRFSFTLNRLFLSSTSQTIRLVSS